MTGHVARSRSLAVALGLAMVAGVVPTPSEAQAGSAVLYQFYIDCPELWLAVDLNEVTCPVTAIDEDDMMGSPSIAVDPREPRHLILSSLHGGDGDGPTERSRNAMPFTTFISYNHGASWIDRPYFPPGRLSGSFGEHAQVVIDKRGQLYVGSLYSTRDGGAPSGWSYTIVAQKFEGIIDVERRQRGEASAQYLEPYYDGNVVPEFWFVNDPASDLTTLVWNERKPVEVDGGLGARGPSLGVAVPGVAEDGDYPWWGRSVVGMAWTTPRLTDRWTYVDERHLIGPCADVSNPVLVEGWIYLACLVDVEEDGYAWDEDPFEGQIDVFRVEVGTGVPEHLGRSPLEGGNPKLAVRSDGRLALLTAQIGSDGNPRVAVAYGVADQESASMRWGDQQNLAHSIMKPRQGLGITEVRVQAAAMREDSGTIHFILKLQYDWLGVNLNDLEAALMPRYQKTLVSIHETHGVLKTYDLDVGHPTNRTPFPTKYNLFKADQEAVFNDLSDTILLFPPGDLPPPPYDEMVSKYHPENYQRQFIAYGDYGVIHFAEIIEVTDLQAVPPALPAVIPAALPTAAVAVTSLILFTGAGALASLLALKLALNKKATESVSIAKGR